MAHLRWQIKYFRGARVIYAEKDENSVEKAYKYAIAGMRKYLRFFGLPPEFQLINIFIAPRRMEYDRLVSHLTKTPTNKGRLGQPQGHDLYLISPNAWPADVHPDYLGRDGKYDKKVYRQFIEHEIVHMIEEQFSPKGAMEIRPQWWSDGIAVYATGQYRDRLNRKLMKEDLEAGKSPMIAGMKGRDAYVWGWSLVRFIEKRLGRGALRSVIQNSCTDDILGFLKLSRSRFEAEWHRTLPALAREAIRG